VQVVLGQVFTRDHGQDARDGQGFCRVDLLDLRVGIGTPDDIEIEHARELNVVHVGAPASDEARILFALDRMPHASDFR
jgi:hypothetical protein